MKRLVVLSIFLSLSCLAFADWNIGDPYKMHYPQLPKSGGLDVEFVASELADDWQCTWSGPVNDLHFWVSWMDNLIQPINNFTVTIYSDIPDPDGSGPAYSMPGQALWSRPFGPGEFAIRDMQDDLQSWFDPSEQWPVNYGPQNHIKWQQININQIFDPFIQEKDTIYWLGINFGTLPFIGWKESGSTHFNDDAVWRNLGGGWTELRHPDPALNYSLDLAFVITPEPAAIVILALGGLCLVRKK